MNEYFSELNNHNNNLELLKIKEAALINKVPIINDEGLNFLLLIARLTKAKKILEIGTAVGYSAINLALLSKDVFVDTIERNIDMVNIAMINIYNLNLDKQINVIVSDALEYNENSLEANYDLIFIDAAKAQYIKFFDKYEKLLKPQGIIVSDNLLFHNLVTIDSEIKSKNIRNLVSKIKNYNQYLSQHKEYQTVFLNIGDGMAVSEKK